MASLLPNGKQYFTDQNGQPLIGGQVYMYVPNTTTFKNTWQDQAQTILNTNPIVLDQYGQAVIWGSGSYRQVVFDVNNNLIYDQITSSYVQSADLSGPNGASLVGYGTGTVADALGKNAVLDNYAALDSYAGSGTNLLLLGGLQKNDSSGGEWYLNPSPTISPNIGTVRLDSLGRTWQRVLTDNVLNPYWFKNTSSDADFTIFQRCIDASIALAIAGVRYEVKPPAGSVFTGTTTINLPSYVCISGNGLRGFIVNYNGSGTLFQCATNMEHATIGGFRIGLGTSGSAKAFDLTTAANTNIRSNKFHDIEIAGASVSGQVGFNQVATVIAGVTYIISENEFENIQFVQLDKPIQDSGSEGNYWRGITVDGFGYTNASIAYNATSNANYFQGRIAGAPVAGSKAVTQGGNRNIAIVVVDIGSASTAIDLGGTGNIVTLERPELLTPIGNVGTGNTVIDSETLYSPGTPKGLATVLANGTISNSWGCISSASKTSTGNFTINFSRSLINPRVHVQLVGLGGAASALIVSGTATNVNIATISTSGSGADPGAAMYIEVTADN